MVNGYRLYLDVKSFFKVWFQNLELNSYKIPGSVYSKYLMFEWYLNL